MKKMDKLIKLNSNEYLFGLSCFFLWYVSFINYIANIQRIQKFNLM